MSDASPSRARLSIPLRILGALLLLGGLAHFAGVTRAYAAHGFPERHRAGYVAMIGVLHMGSGALDMLAAGGLRRGEAWAARVAVVGALLTVAWTGIDLPLILMAQVSPLFWVTVATYLTAHLAVLAALALTARPPR